LRAFRIRRIQEPGCICGSLGSRSLLVPAVIQVSEARPWDARHSAFALSLASEFGLRVESGQGKRGAKGREDGHCDADFTGNYLTTSYEPDVDYVDGMLEDRNVANTITMCSAGDSDLVLSARQGVAHSSIQEQRTRVASTRFAFRCLRLSRDVLSSRFLTRPQLIASRFCLRRPAFPH